MFLTGGRRGLDGGRGGLLEHPGGVTRPPRGCGSSEKEGGDRAEQGPGERSGADDVEESEPGVTGLLGGAGLVAGGGQATTRQGDGGGPEEVLGRKVGQAGGKAHIVLGGRTFRPGVIN